VAGAQGRTVRARRPPLALLVDSSGNSEIEPYWRLCASRTGGSYTSLEPGDARSLAQVITDLLRTAPDVPVDYGSTMGACRALHTPSTFDRSQSMRQGS
jgi:hypothetical protein